MKLKNGGKLLMSTLVNDVNDFVTRAKAMIGDLNVNHVQNDIDEYFNLTVNDLSRMSKEDCVKAQYFIMQFSISLTKKINSYKSSLFANKKEFNRALSGVYGSYSSYNGYDIILGQACGEHTHIRDMDTEITKLECLIQEFEGLSFKAEKLAQVLKDLSFCK